MAFRGYVVLPFEEAVDPTKRLGYTNGGTFMQHACLKPEIRAFMKAAQGHTWSEPVWPSKTYFSEQRPESIKFGFYKEADLIQFKLTFL